LFGSASRHDTLDSTGAPTGAAAGAIATPQSTAQDLKATDNAAKLESEKAAADLYALAVQKLSQKQKLSADEYRSLGVGTTGVESWHSFQWFQGGFNKVGTVNVVYADSPAEKAGIRLGDKITYGARDLAVEAKQRANPYLSRVLVTFAPEGTPLDVTILRHKQPPIKITLIRMNIEDIKEPRIRHEWERMIRNLGFPKEGTYTGSSDSHLSR